MSFSIAMRLNKACPAQATVRETEPQQLWRLGSVSGRVGAGGGGVASGDLQKIGRAHSTPGHFECHVPEFGLWNTMERHGR